MPRCPHCNGELPDYRNPVPTVDIIIELPRDDAGIGIVLIKRRNPPLGWALPGGFIDYGESAEDAAVREALEETGLQVQLVRLLGVYSDPSRDPRHHTITTAFVARADGTPFAGDDAAGIEVFSIEALPGELAFDHAEIINDYLEKRQ